MPLARRRWAGHEPPDHGFPELAGHDASIVHVHLKDWFDPDRFFAPDQIRERRTRPRERLSVGTQHVERDPAQPEVDESPVLEAVAVPLTDQDAPLVAGAGHGHPTDDEAPLLTQLRL